MHAHMYSSSAEHTPSELPIQAPNTHTDVMYNYIDEIQAPTSVSCDLTSNEAYDTVQCVTNESYSVLP